MILYVLKEQKVETFFEFKIKQNIPKHFSKKHWNMEHLMKLMSKECDGNRLVIGKRKSDNSEIIVSDSFRKSGIEWENKIYQSNMKICGRKWLNFSVNTNKLSFLNKSYVKIGCFGVETAYLKQLFTDSYPNIKTNEKSVLKVTVNTNVIDVLIRHVTLQSITEWINQTDSIVIPNDNNNDIECAKYSFGSEIEILLTNGVILKIVQNKSKAKLINPTVLKSDKVFVNGIGYMMVNNELMHSDLILHSDFLRQIQMEIYLKNSLTNKTNIKCEIINYADEYKDKLTVLNHQTKPINYLFHFPKTLKQLFQYNTSIRCILAVKINKVTVNPHGTLIVTINDITGSCRVK